MCGSNESSGMTASYDKCQNLVYIEKNVPHENNENVLMFIKEHIHIQQQMIRVDALHPSKQFFSHVMKKLCHMKTMKMY